MVCSKYPFFLRTVVLAIVALFTACTVSYKFNGASIDYSKVRTLSISDFPNRAPLVYPPLSNSLSEELRDIFARQTRLTILRQDGQLQLEGEIIGYELTPMAIAADNYAAQTKLTLTVKVRFTNSIAPEENFEKSYSAFQTFDAGKTLSDVQEELCNTMITEIVESIFNDTVAKW